MNSPFRVGELRHRSLIKGVSIVVIVSLVLARAVPEFALYFGCVGLGALLSYFASLVIFQF